MQHLQNKCFALKFKFRRNASKFPIFIQNENPSNFFRFSFRATFIFPLMNALVYVDIDQGIHKGKNESCSKWKTKKTTWVFFLYKYRKFWSVSLEFKLEHKTFILDVWICSIGVKKYHKIIKINWLWSKPPNQIFFSDLFESEK